jgi:hypothetical protein
MDSIIDPGIVIVNGSRMVRTIDSGVIEIYIIMQIMRFHSLK